jgi:hypothetical protein
MKDNLLKYFESLIDNDSQKSNVLLIRALKDEKNKLMNQGSATSEEIAVIFSLLSKLDDRDAA